MKWWLLFFNFDHSIKIWHENSREEGIFQNSVKSCNFKLFFKGYKITAYFYTVARTISGQGIAAYNLNVISIFKQLIAKNYYFYIIYIHYLYFFLCLFRKQYSSFKLNSTFLVAKKKEQLCLLKTLIFLYFLYLTYIPMKILNFNILLILDKL